MRICVLGAGAIGGFLGTRLATAGVKTSAVARGATLDALRTHGWRVRERDGSLTTAPVHATADAAELGVQDLVILAVKAQSLHGALDSLLPLVGTDTTVVAALNGVPWWFFDGFGGPCRGVSLDSVDPGGLLARKVPARHVVGAVVYLSGTSPEPGLARHVSGNRFILGEPDGSDSPRVRELAALLGGAGLGAEVSTRIHRDIWRKLWGTMTMNPVTALTRATADRVFDDPLVLRFCRDIMLEARRVGDLIGCPTEETPEARMELIRGTLGAARARTSMLQDMEAGRALELDALVGALHDIGEQVGVPTPNIDALLGLTRLAAACR